MQEAERSAGVITHGRGLHQDIAGNAEAGFIVDDRGRDGCGRQPRQFPVSTSDAMQEALTESEAYAEGGGVLANRLSTRGAMAREVVRE